MKPIVAALTCYPVKGCAGVRLERAAVLSTGIELDRSFAVVGDDGVCLSQRTHPAMAAIGVEPHDGLVVLAAPGAPVIDVAVVDDGKRLPVRVFSHRGDGVDQGDAVAEWFSTVLGTSCRLLRVPPDHTRVSGGETEGTAGFADGHAVTVVSHASLDELNARIIERGGEPVPIERFRANIVVASWQEPHTEDRVRRMSAGTAQFGYAKRDVRCKVTMVDQATGRPSGPEPIPTLSSYRSDPADGGVAFAIKAAVTSPGEVAVGDPVHVLRWGDGLR